METRKRVIYGKTGSGKSYIHISDYIRSNDNVVIFTPYSIQGQVKYSSLALEEITETPHFGGEFHNTVYDFSEIPEICKAKHYMEVISTEVVQKMVSREDILVIFWGIPMELIQNEETGFCKMVTSWKCRVVIEVSCSQKDYFDDREFLPFSTKEWELQCTEDILNQMIEFLEKEGGEFPGKEKYHEKYKKNLYQNLKKYKNLGYTDVPTCVYLARMASRYVCVDECQITPDMSLRKIKNVVEKETGVIPLGSRFPYTGTEFYLLDVESTGMSADDEVVEIAVISNTGSIIFNEMFSPKTKICKEAGTINHITDSMLTEKKPISKYAHKLLNILSNRPLLIYNRAFDTRMILQSLDKYKDEIEDYRNLRVRLEDNFRNNSFCMMQSYAEYQESPCVCSLESALKDQGIEIQQQHRAVYDCQDTLKLINILIQ